MTSQPATTLDEVWTGPGHRDGTLTVVTERDNARHPSESRTAFEHWYYDAHLDSGHTVVAFLQMKRPEEPPWAKPVVELLVYYPDGTRRQITQRHAKSDFEASTDRCDVRIGRSHGSSDYSGTLPTHRLYAVAADADGEVSFDLTFANETPSWMPGKGYSNITDKDTFGWVVPGPRAAVSGTIVLDGETLEVAGRGYHDHNWGTGAMPRVIEKWHWGRLYTEDFTLIYSDVMLQKRFGYHTSGLVMLAQGQDVLLSSGEMTLTEGPPAYSPAAHRSYPRWIRFVVEPSVPEDPRIDLRLDIRQVIHAHDLLDDAPLPPAVRGPLKPVLRALVGQPGYFRFDSAYRLEVTIGGPDGTTHVETGRTLHELVALH